MMHIRNVRLDDGRYALAVARELGISEQEYSGELMLGRSPQDALEYPIARRRKLVLQGLLDPDDYCGSGPDCLCPFCVYVPSVELLKALLRNDEYMGHRLVLVEAVHELETRRQAEAIAWAWTNANPPVYGGAYGDVKTCARLRWPNESIIAKRRARLWQAAKNDAAVKERKDAARYEVKAKRKASRLGGKLKLGQKPEGGDLDE